MMIKKNENLYLNLKNIYMIKNVFVYYRESIYIVMNIK